MGERDKDPGRFELSRRDFLKVSAASATAVGIGMDLMPAPAMAITPEGDDTSIVTKITTCPYCSAQCGQKVAVGNVTGRVYDVYGDSESPTSRGGLCAKGAGAFQLATNLRRLGVAGAPGDANFTGKVFGGAYPDATRSMFEYVAPGAGAEEADPDGGIAYKRVGNGTWTRMKLSVALTEAAAALYTARGAVPTPGLTADSNSKGVQFFGSSHINNEANYVYRKIIADFGTSCVEHQARI
ncbi:MAG: twin-arginine translocation signal domain-containing protein [Coriobacteriia bacterium]|nr:twin-arginine translocation signal domain-containing protein [Coriobacteriia bacterium]